MIETEERGREKSSEERNGTKSRRKPKTKLRCLDKEDAMHVE